MSRTYYVYILSSRSRTIYTGVTNNLPRRIAEHRSGVAPGFASKYKISRLVHFEMFSDIRDAILREKQIKKWRHEEKIVLIESRNPSWTDLAAEMLAPPKQ